MSIHKREGKRGVKWVVRYRDRGGVHRQESFTVKADALSREREVIREVETGQVNGRDARRVTLTEYVQTSWAPQHADQLAPKTRQGYLHAWKTRVKPALGDMPLASINVRTVKQWQAEQIAEARRQSVEKESDRLVGQVAIERARTVLSSILSSAAEDGLIAINPVSVVRKLKGKRDAHGQLRQPDKLNIPEPLMVETLRLQFGERDRALVAVLAYAGLRPGEAWRLKWSDIEGSSLRVWARKTGGKVRQVPIRGPLSAWLEDWRSVCPDASDDALMFAGRDGGLADHRAWVARHWKPAVKAIGAPVTLRPYDLRHACASMLVAEDRSIVECAEWMGHSPMMFLNTYAHVLEGFRGAGKIDADAVIVKARIDAEAQTMFAICSQVSKSDDLQVIPEIEKDAQSPENTVDW